MNWDEFEQAVGIKRNVAPTATRADADRMRRRKLMKRWRKIRAVRKR